MEDILAFLLTALILFFIGLRLISIEKYKKPKYNAKIAVAEQFLKTYRQELCYQFYETCKYRGVQDITRPEDMEIALNILKYDQRFSRLKKDSQTVFEQFQKVKELDQQADTYTRQIAQINNSEQLQEQQLYGEHGFEILQALREDVNNWKKYMNKGVVSAIRCWGDTDEVYYVLFHGKNGLNTYYSQSRAAYERKPDLYIKSILQPKLVDVPGSATYTSATVGGITTGGWDIKEAHTEVQWESKGVYGVCIGYGSIKICTDQIADVWIGDSTMEFVKYNDSLNRALIQDENKIRIGNTQKNFCEAAKAMIEFCITEAAKVTPQKYKTNAQSNSAESNILPNKTYNMDYCDRQSPSMKVLVWLPLIITVIAIVLNLLFYRRCYLINLSRSLRNNSITYIIALIIPIATLFLKKTCSDKKSKIMIMVIIAFFILQVFCLITYVPSHSGIVVKTIPGGKLLHHIAMTSRAGWKFFSLGVISECLFYVNNIIALVSTINIFKRNKLMT